MRAFTHSLFSDNSQVVESWSFFMTRKIQAEKRAESSTEVEAHDLRPRTRLKSEQPTAAFHQKNIRVMPGYVQRR